MTSVRIPKLFVWGRYGLPAEFRGYVFRADCLAKMARGEKPYRGAAKFFADGIEYLAEQLLLDLTQKRLRDSRRVTSETEIKPAPLKISHELASWVYLFHAYCFSWGQPATPKLLQLSFEVLGLREGRPAAGVEADLGGPVGIKNFSAFLLAAQIDGEADATGHPMTVSAVAREVGVSRKTIGGWRAMPDYEHRRQFCRSATGRRGGVRKKP